MVDMSKGKAAFLHFLPFCHIDFAKVHIYFEITLTKMCKKKLKREIIIIVKVYVIRKVKNSSLFT